MDASPPPSLSPSPPAHVEHVAPRPESSSPAEPAAPREGAHVDLGVGSFLRSGVGTSGVVGISFFVTDPISDDVVLRIAISGARSPAGGLHMTWAAGRLDTCLVAGGNYARGGGLALDLCGGFDAGATFMASTSDAAQTAPYIDFGPSVDLRAEVGRQVALTLRVAGGLNIARDSFIDASGAQVAPPLATLQIELDLSWALGLAPARGWGSAAEARASSPEPR
ncbi:MAG TPA: hypothetical protein VH044_00775 [Polyangiaceae bacterium]|jgi:hypothetical protein|nr:hypothetical protein [Polyangiaceae bacterium]